MRHPKPSHIGRLLVADRRKHRSPATHQAESRSHQARRFGFVTEQGLRLLELGHRSLPAGKVATFARALKVPLERMALAVHRQKVAAAKDRKA